MANKVIDLVQKVLTSKTEAYLGSVNKQISDYTLIGVGCSIPGGTVDFPKDLYLKLAGKAPEGTEAITDLIYIGGNYVLATALVPKTNESETKI